MEPTQIFCDEVRSKWGNPYSVAEAALNELFRHGDDICLDHDDQVDFAKKVGVLAGVMKDNTPDEFIAAFSEQVLNE